MKNTSRCLYRLLTSGLFSIVQGRGAAVVVVAAANGHNNSIQTVSNGDSWLRLLRIFICESVCICIMHAHVICRYMAHEEDLFVSGNYYVVIISSYCV